jgi:hypothetical protein
MPTKRSKALTLIAAILLAFSLTACIHSIQETTCKFKFKKKYDCPFKKIEIVEDEMVVGDYIRLRGCGKTVTYEGTKEVLVAD